MLNQDLTKTMEVLNLSMSRLLNLLNKPKTVQIENRCAIDLGQVRRHFEFNTDENEAVRDTGPFYTRHFGERTLCLVCFSSSNQT